MAKHPKIKLSRIQIKSAEKARLLAKLLDQMEIEFGIGVTCIKLKDPFICPDIEWDKIQDTPMERVLSEIVNSLK